MWTGCVNKNFVHCPHAPVPVTVSETFRSVNAYIAQESEIQPTSTHQNCGAFVAQICILELALIFSNSSSKDVMYRAPAWSGSQSKCPLNGLYLILQSTIQLVPGDFSNVFNWACQINSSKSRSNSAVIFTVHACRLTQISAVLVKMLFQTCQMRETCFDVTICSWVTYLWLNPDKS